MKSRSGVWLTISAITVVTSVSCSTADYGSSEPDPKGNQKAIAAPETTSGKTNSPNGENVVKKSNSKPGAEFFSAGKSLDLHVIMDKSGSLYVDPTAPTKMGSGSDPTCKRMDALLDLIDALKTKLTRGEFVRLTVVTFGNDSDIVGSVEDVLKQSRTSIDSALRSGVCTYPGQLETTNYSKGIRESLGELKRWRTIKKLDIETSLFFSDGAARDNPSSLEAAIADLNSEFPKRVFGILLGNTSDGCSLKESGRGLTNLECLRKVAGNAPEKVVQTADAAGLSAAMKSLLEK
jgi:hypothetical protein